MKPKPRTARPMMSKMKPIAWYLRWNERERLTPRTSSECELSGSRRSFQQPEFRRAAHHLALDRGGEVKTSVEGNVLLGRGLEVARQPTLVGVGEPGADERASQPL